MAFNRNRLLKKGTLKYKKKIYNEMNEMITFHNSELGFNIIKHFGAP